MKNALIVSLLALAATISVGSATPPRDARAENSMDSPRRGKRPPHIPNMPEAAQSPSSADVGDGDSFGRSVNFLGYVQTYGVSILEDCTGWEPGTCAVTDGSSFVTIEKFGEESVLRLPARAARSLLCFTTTPFAFLDFRNTSTTRQDAIGTLLARWRIESEVLNDPTLINVNTGQPFNGVIENGAFVANELFTIEPGASRLVAANFSRNCNSGTLRRQALIEMGLTAAQAREVFRRPITIRFGASMSLGWGTGSMSPGFRIYGD